MGGRRVAFIVANAEYQVDSLKLEGPTRDAAAFKHRLIARAGFREGDVQLHLNVTQEELRTALQAWQQQVHGSSLALFMYAGHGLECAGKPVMMCKAWEGGRGRLDVEREGVNLQLVLDALQGCEKSLILLDACRSHTVDPGHMTDGVQGLTAAGTKNWVPRGLHAVTVSSSRPVSPCLMALACTSGGEAIEQEDQGLFTEALLKHLFQHDVNVLKALSNAAEAVAVKSDGRQRPETVYSVFHDDFMHPLSRMAGEPGCASSWSNRWRNRHKRAKVAIILIIAVMTVAAISIPVCVTQLLREPTTHKGSSSIAAPGMDKPRSQRADIPVSSSGPALGPTPPPPTAGAGQGRCPAGWYEAALTVYDPWPYPNTEKWDYQGAPQGLGLFDFRDNSPNCNNHGEVNVTSWTTPSGDHGSIPGDCRWRHDWVASHRIVSVFKSDSSPVTNIDFNAQIQGKNNCVASPASAARNQGVKVFVADTCYNDDCNVSTYHRCCDDGANNSASKFWIEMEKNTLKAVFPNVTNFVPTNINYSGHTAAYQGPSFDAGNIKGYNDTVCFRLTK